MTWKTIYVLSSESGLPESLTNRAADANTDHTGVYGIGLTGPGTLADFAIPAYTSLKAGYWQKITYLLDDTRLFGFYNSDLSVALGRVMYYDGDTSIAIDITPGSKNAIISAYSTPIMRSFSKWVHIGLFIKAGTISFYINGKKYLSYSGTITGARLLMGRSSGIGNGEHFIDDLFIQTSDENEFDEAPPGYRYYPRRVTYPTLNEWVTYSPNVIEDNSVFEVPNNGDTSRIETDTNDKRALYRIQNVPFQVPFGYESKTITVQATARHNGAGNIKTVMTDGVNEIVSPTITLDSTYKMIQFTSDIAPDGTDLDNNKVNQLEYGVESGDIT